MQAIIYCRVSTKEQAEKGYSLEGQEKDCQQFALNQGLNVVKVFVERGESAKTQDRTQLKNLIQYCVQNKKKLSAIIIWKYDRLARNLSDQTELVKNFSSLGIRFLSATENNEPNAVGNLMRNIIGTFAQFENDVKSERTTNGMKQALQQGRWCWRAPFGYKGSRDDHNKPLIVPAEDSRYVIDAFEKFITGLYKQTDIVERVRQLGYKKANKGFINRLLTNPLYTGLIKCEWFPEYIEALHKPIISREVFFKAQEIITGKRPSIVPKLLNHPDFPLRRFVRCPKCGEKLTAGWSTGRKKQRYGYYHCRVKGCSFGIKKDVLEEKFFELLKTLEPREDVIDLFNAIVIDALKKVQSEEIKEECRIEKELKELNDQLERVEELAIKGTFDDDTYKRKSEKLKAEILAKQVELNETTIELNNAEACLNYCKFFLKNIAHLWSVADINLKQRFQTLIFPDRITYNDNGTFGTTVTALIFKQLQGQMSRESQLVAPTGFEPVFYG